MGIRKALTALADIPARQYTITVNRNEELFVENCVCVVGFRSCEERDGLIALRVCDSIIEVRGEYLVLESFGAYGVKIRGKITGISFTDCGGASGKGSRAE